MLDEFRYDAALGAIANLDIYIALSLRGQPELTDREAINVLDGCCRALLARERGRPPANSRHHGAQLALLRGVMEFCEGSLAAWEARNLALGIRTAGQVPGGRQDAAADPRGIPPFPAKALRQLLRVQRKRLAKQRRWAFISLIRKTHCPDSRPPETTAPALAPMSV